MGEKPQGEWAGVLKFGLNGLVATGVHFGVLTFILTVLQVSTAGVANLVAALFGISASFLGNRYFVFPKREGTLVRQFLRFSLLYGILALMHGSVLFLWTDVFRFDYRLGFLGATGLQVMFSYFGSKKLVFDK